MAIKKPKKIVTAKMPMAGGKSTLKKPRLSAPRAAPKPAQPTAPPPPAQAVVPPTPVVTPPPRPSLSTATDRESAMRRYTEAMNEVNTQIRNLAANYGGASKVLQFGYTPGGADSQTELGMTTNQPGTQLEVMLRNLQANKQNVNDSYLAGGAFFGSQRVGKLGELDTAYKGDLSAAERAYNQAVSDLTRQLEVERGNRTETFTRADIEDLLAAAATTPEAQSGPVTIVEPPAPAPAPAPAATVKPTPVGTGTQQRSFSEYRNSNGHLVRDYGNGKKQVYVNGVWKWVK